MAKTVAEIMTHEPIVVTSETSLDEAIQIMAERRFSGLPVVDATGNLIGIISQGDLMWRESGVTPPPYIMVLDSVIYLENPAKYQRDLHKALGQTVGEVMTKNPQTIRPEKSLREAAELMHEKGVHRLPVIDSVGKPIGILTRGDIVRAMATEEG
ncbi:CBS domain-containing protein [Laspinema olomoucense]|uniref:CBS domain-containing protein n=1 Tax=Laspinema olomoucense D3b TaxID=2953688 RepID=A0ABT2N3U9_9CYAN|nr:MULTISPECIES: CBS domain-containing protein [unclassified Laspinema]MCT7977363.1 CBS domain-containing protein [Laspinema sp. D3b]MCT7986783.1 CBS domain-containing protein [Laspinema sp. D3a]